MPEDARSWIYLGRDTIAGAIQCIVYIQYIILYTHSESKTPMRERD